MPFLFPCSPVIRECLWNKIQKKKFVRVTDILKFYEVLFCTYCKGLFCLYKIAIMVIFLHICMKHSQHQEMRKNRKLNFTKNCQASWLSFRQLKISKCSISLAGLGVLVKPLSPTAVILVCNLIDISHLNSILMLSDCVDERLTLDVVLRYWQCCK